MQRTLPDASVEIAAHAWRLRFHDTQQPYETLPAGSRIIEVSTPRKLHVVCEPAEVGYPPSRADDPGGRSLSLLWMPPLAPEEADEAWLEGIPFEGLRDNGRVVRAGLRTARVVWTNARAIIYATPDQFVDALDALIRFTVLEREATEIEMAMPEVWASIKYGKPLTHTVSRRDIRRFARPVGIMTERVSDLNRRALHSDEALEQLDPGLTGASKRLFAELALQANLYDRLEALGEPLDFAFEHHEVVNNRLTEASHHYGNTRVEVWILAVLLIELALTAYYMFWPLVRQG